MQIQSQCVSCLISRAFEETQLATSDQEVQLQAMKEVASIVHQALHQGKYIERIPAYVGTLRDQAIQRITSCPDPYETMKKHSNESALKFLPHLEKFVKRDKDFQKQFRRACLVASLGNVIEYGVAGHHIPWEELTNLIIQTENELAIDHITRFFDLAQESKSILYLADNSGEIVFDRLLIQTLSELSSKITVAVKAAPILNDAMLADAKMAGIDEIAEVVTTGGGAVGVLPRWCSQRFLNRFASTDLVIAKGMGHWETLPEFSLPSSTAHLLRTKCEPIARSLNVPKGRNIVKLLIDHQGPLGPLTAPKTLR